MLPDGRIECQLCPRFCKLNEGQRGFCFVRQRVGDRIILTTYGRSSGFCVDPIEKKPLNHFFPGTAVLSFGTAGCNLGCRFSQNWDISKARAWDKLTEVASREGSSGRLSVLAVAPSPLRTMILSFLLSMLWTLPKLVTKAEFKRSAPLCSLQLGRGITSAEIADA